MALAFEQREYSLPELDALANGMATALEHRGVRPGERVALMSSNRPEFVVALWASWRLGASAVLLSPAWKRTEVENALALTTPSYAVGDHPVLAELMPMVSLDEAIASEQIAGEQRDDRDRRSDGGLARNLRQPERVQCAPVQHLEIVGGDRGHARRYRFGVDHDSSCATASGGEQGPQEAAGVGALECGDVLG